MPIRKQDRFLTFLSIVFLAVVLVRSVPFSARLALDAVEPTGEGSLLRQILYLLLFLAAVAPLALREPQRLLQAAPGPYVALLLFCLLSLSWSSVPTLAGRRLGLTLVVSYPLLLMAHQMRPERTLELARAVFIGLSMLTLITGLAFPSLAIHQPGDPEASIVGAWRGIFYHKNLAGSVVAVAVLLTVDQLFQRRRRALHWALLVLLAATLILTDSKTSAGAVLLALFGFILIRHSVFIERNDPTAAKFYLLVVGCVVLSAIAAVWLSFDLSRSLSDPDAFTGRGQLWQVVTELVLERPIHGWGYQSVFQVGAGPTPEGVPTWIQQAPHSHNGLLDILVSIGAIGAVLYFWCFVFYPLRKAAILPNDLKRRWLPVVGGLILFAVMHSMLEGNVLSGEAHVFVVLTLVLGLTVKLHRVAAARFRIEWQRMSDAGRRLAGPNL